MMNTNFIIKPVLIIAKKFTVVSSTFVHIHRWQGTRTVVSRTGQRIGSSGVEHPSSSKIGHGLKL